MKRKITSIIIAVAMTIMLLPSGVFTAFADDEGTVNVSYMFYDQNTKAFHQSVCPHPTLVKSDTTTWSTGWYVVDGNVEISSRVIVTGNVYLILKDGCQLTVDGGIDVAETNSFTVLAQSAGTGALIAFNNVQSAGIGGGKNQNGGTVVIHGGIVTATGSEGAGIGGGFFGNGGTTIIYGGTVTATGNDSAGIGGGFNGNGGTTIIYGGTVTATGNNSAGIGGGSLGDGGTTKIYGGTVTANGGKFGAGIGGGFYGFGGMITINGGNVIANGGSESAGIGSGLEGSGCELTVNGGKVTANGGEDAPGINAAVTVNGGNVTAIGDENATGIIGSFTINGGTVKAEGLAGINCTATVNGGCVTAIGTYSGAGIGGYYQQPGVEVTINGGIIFASSKLGSAIGAGKEESNPGTINVNDGVRLLDLDDGTYFTKADGEEWTDVLSGSTVCFVAEKINEPNPSVPYLAYDAETGSFTEEECEYGDFRFLTKNMTELTSGTYVVCGIPMTVDHSININGNVSLILTDGCDLTVNDGILLNAGNSFTVYAQSSGNVAGRLTVVRKKTDCAGIGGYKEVSCGTVTINGGIITAKGGDYAAGIGGGYKGNGGTVTIRGGTITSTGGYLGAGIGGGRIGNGGTVTISGGTVTATGGDNAAGIGGGNYGNGGTVTINGGTVLATGGDGGAGIGGGQKGGDGTVIISDGTVTATGGNRGAGIGGGKAGNGGTVTINGGTVTAKGGDYAAGIGGGQLGGGSELSIAEELSVYNDDTKEEITRTGEKTWASVIGSVPVLITEPYTEPEDEGICYLEYTDGTFVEKTYTGKKYFAGTLSNEWENNWYVAEDNVIIDDRVTVTGDVKLILTDGCTLEVNGGIEVNAGNSLTVYAQSTGEKMGKLIASAGDTFVAGIGSENEKAGGTVTIHGGNILATGGVNGGAGIGSGAYYIMDYEYDSDDMEYDFFEYGTAGNITIYGGIVTAYGGYNSAGIGGGSGCDGGTIKIYGGTVKASGDSYFTAGIGHGAYEVEYYEISSVFGEGTVTVYPASEQTPIHVVKYDDSTRTSFYKQQTDITSNLQQEKSVGIYGDHVDENNDGICDICEATFADFAFNSKSLALDSVFAFRFKGYLNVTPADGAYMEFKVGKIRTVNVPLAEAETDTEGRIVFTCLLDVLEVDEKIEAIFHNGEDTFVRKNPLSVTDYLDQVEANHTGKTGAEDVATLNLINAISNYAHWAQKALDESHDDYTVGNKAKDKYRQTAKRTDITQKTSTELADFAATRTVKDGYTAITKTSRSLVLDDETAIVIYLTPTDKTDNYTSVVNVTKGGNDYAFTLTKQSDGRWKLVIPDIAASELADVFTVNIDNGGMTFTNLSALSYAYTVLASKSSSTNYKYAVSALYDYYLATKAYITATKGE